MLQVIGRDRLSAYLQSSCRREVPKPLPRSGPITMSWRRIFDSLAVTENVYVPW